MTPLQGGDVSYETGTLLGDLFSRWGVPEAGSVGAALTFLAVLALVYFAGKLVALPLLDRALRVRGLDAHARRPLRKLALAGFAFVAVAAAFGAAGFDDFLQSLATIAAAATLAVGLAMQEVLKNFVAGVFIFADRPFRIGDWIEWEGHAGVVEDISFRVTRVRTFDNELLTVPNSALTDGVIKNPVAKNTLRLTYEFGIGYDDDVDAASEILLEEAENHPDILDEPAPSVRLTELADSHVGLKSRFWIANPTRSDFVRTRAEYATNVKRRFDEAGVEIPFPQRELTGDLRMVSPVEAREPAD